MSSLETFRKETRAWLESNCPPEMRRPIQTEDDTCWGGRHWVFQSDAQRLWLTRMSEKGWTVPEWPREDGGFRALRDGTMNPPQKIPSGACPPPPGAFRSPCPGPSPVQDPYAEHNAGHLH